MMSESQRAQCLLFVPADRKPGCLRKSSRSATKSMIKGYALLPQSFRDEHPEVIELFSRNDIIVIRNAEDCPSLQTSLKNFTLEMFEMQLMFESSESEDAPSDVSNPMLVLVDDFDREVVGLILSKEVEISYISNEEKTGYTSVDSDDDLNIIQHFISCNNTEGKFGKDIAYRHFNGGTIIHFAVKRKQEKLLKLLLQRGVDIDAKRLDGMTPLHVAAKKGFVEVVKMLLQFGADVNAEIETEFEEDRGFTALVLAFRNDHPEVVGLLLESGADVNIQFNNFVSHHSMHYLDSPEENLESKFKVTLLYSATLMECSEEIRAILRHKPDLDNEYNKRAFHYILFELEDDFKDIFKQMQEYGFVVDYDLCKNPIKYLFGAIHKNCIEVVHKIVEAGVNVNEVLERRFSEKLTPLHMAARHAGGDIIQLLISKGADVNVELEKSKEFPIHGAVNTNNISAVKYFLANNINFPDKANLILLAARNGNSELIEFLLVNGYPLTFKDE